MSTYVPIYNIRLVKDRNIRLDKQVGSPQHTVDILSAMLSDLDSECFIVILLNTRNKVLGTTVVAQGGLNTVYLRIADVFKAAILAGADSVIVAHNHPSGDPEPSPEDIEVTRRLIEAGQLLDIQVLDHVVYADYAGQRTVSLRERWPSLWH